VLILQTPFTLPEYLRIAMKHKNFNDRIQLMWLGRGEKRSEPRAIINERIQAVDTLRDEIQSSVEELRNCLSNLDPSEILPLVVLQNMARRTYSPSRITDPNSQTFTEYITSISLQVADQDYKQITAEDTIKIRDLVERIFWFVCLLFDANLSNDETLNESERQISSQAYRNYLLVRGETYDTNFLKAAVKLFDSQSNYLEKRYGFNVRQAVGCAELIRKLVNNRLQSENNTLLVILKKLAISEKTTSIWPVGMQTTIRNRRFVVDNNLIPSDLPAFARNIFLASEQELLNLVDKNDRSAMISFLKWISITPGELKDIIIYPSQDNPVQNKPIVHLDQNYLLHAIAYLGRCLYYRLDKELMSDAYHSQQYNHIRATYLENEAISVFKNILPSAEAYSQLKYKVSENGQTTNCELDGLVKYDNNVFLVECASHQVRMATKKGAKEPIMYDLKQTIERTFLQAKRAKNYIQTNDNASFLLNDGSTIVVDRKAIVNYHLISVTLDSYDFLAVDPRKLKNIGLFNDDEYPWPIYIENFKTISKFIEFPSQFLHYLRKRKKVSKNIYASDELDYFGCYLLLNLDIPMPADDIEKVFIVSATNDFDAYFTNQAGLGPRVPKPRQYLPKNVRKIVFALERLQPPGYTNITCALLDIILPIREKFEECIVSTLTRSKENSGAVKDFSVIDKDGEWGFTYFCGDGSQKENVEKLVYLNDFCLMKIEQTGILSWIGLVNDTSRKSPIDGIFFSESRSNNRDHSVTI
jgi:hypothetical protein